MWVCTLTLRGTYQNHYRLWICQASENLLIRANWYLPRIRHHTAWLSQHLPYGRSSCAGWLYVRAEAGLYVVVRHSCGSLLSYETAYAALLQVSLHSDDRIADSWLLCRCCQHKSHGKSNPIQEIFPWWEQQAECLSQTRTAARWNTCRCGYS